MIVDQVREAIAKAIAAAGFPVPENVPVDVPPAGVGGHFASPVALALSKVVGKAPKEVAEAIVAALPRGELVAEASVAGPGFVNVALAPSVIVAEVAKAAAAGSAWGSFDELAGKRVLVEYSCPNPFKPLHVGHLMANAIGESLSRLYAAAGADVVRVTYGGDIGLHVAKTIWAMARSADVLAPGASVAERTRFVGACYAAGSTAYEEDVTAKEPIDDLNRRIFAGQMTPDEQAWYDRGRGWSIEHFHDVYAAIGSRFDAEVWEREVEARGKEIVLANVGKVFEESQGAVVYKGEKVGLHTRVFVTSKGLPAYEAKEVGWAFEKEDRWHPDALVLETGAEQTQYFKVVQAALAEIAPEIPAKTSHVTHGLMRLADGKISSRKGTGMTALDLLELARERAASVLEGRELGDAERGEIANAVAVAAIKYQILKQVPGKEVVFDVDAATAIEGDSGPYIQYAAVRAASLVRKAREAGVEARAELPAGEALGELELAVARLPEVVRRSYRDRAPQVLANYLVALASAFNGWYDRARIVGEAPEIASWRLAVAESARAALAAGLDALGIAVPEKM